MSPSYTAQPLVSHTANFQLTHLLSYKEAANLKLTGNHSCTHQCTFNSPELVSGHLSLLKFFQHQSHFLDPVLLPLPNVVSEFIPSADIQHTAYPQSIVIMFCRLLG